MATAGPSRGPDLWKPSRYLEPNHPDNEEVLEQAAYMAAITRPPGDTRVRKYKPRKTVDFMGSIVKWRQMTKLRGPHAPLPAIHPNPSDLINLLPPAAHRDNPSTSICDHYVHTSVNKERSPTRVVKWTPDARRLLTGNDKGQFTLWNGQSFNYESITQVHDDSVRAFSYSHNGQALVSVDKIGMIKYFTPHLTNIHGFQGHREACHGAAWSPNDERFVTGGDDGLVKIWNYREAKEEKVLSGHGWDVRCVDWHPTKGLVVSGSKDMLVKFWDPRSGKDISTLHSHKAVVNACSWNPNGQLVATAGGDGLIRMFDIRTFRELDPMKGHTKEVNCLEWHPIHPNILTSGDSAGAIIYWSLLSPNPSEPMTTLSNAHDDAVFSLSFHPLGHLLCSGSKDFSARFWSRARPVGGQEIDRWHLGEEKAIEARMEEEREKLQQIRKAREDQSAAAAGPAPGLPGLPGLSNFRNENGSASNAQMPSGGGSLPGFGGLPGFGNSNSSAMPPRNGPPPPGPPSRSWGSDPMSAGGMRANGPLPLQSEMRKFGAPGYGDDRGPPGGGGYNRGGPPAQGNGYGDRDRYGGAPSQGYGPPAGEYGRAPLPPGREHVSMPAGRENYGPPVGAYGRDPRDQQRGYGNQQGGYQNNQGGGGGGGGWR